MPFFFEFPAGETKIKNTIRIEVEEELRSVKGLRFIVQEILFGVFGLKNGDILCLQDQERKGVYTITFNSLAACENIYAVLSNKKLNEARLDGLKFFLLYGLEDVPMVVHLYNPHVDTADVIIFLQRYCSEVRFSHMVKNELGFWNGKRKFLVKFRRDPEGIGGFMHPPSNFILGRNRGYLFYSGMPLYCRNCLRFGHTKEVCAEARVVRCNKCGEPGHLAATCPLPKTCNMCGQAGHIYSSCPSRTKKVKTYAEKVASGPVPPRSEQKSTAVVDSAKTTLGKSSTASERNPQAVPVASSSGRSESERS
uniref:CCHC-type domain-containing protein n=1 Tax=Xenopus tropicalis TaxID=8364 RepID=A0A803K1D5_XENTR